MEKKKVTSEDLRGMAIGQTVEFELPDDDAVRRGRLLAHAQARALHCRFATRSNYIDDVLTVTKLPYQP